MCRTCARKRLKPVKSDVVNPIVSHGFNMIEEVNLIDLQLNKETPSSIPAYTFFWRVNEKLPVA